MNDPYVPISRRTIGELTARALELRALAAGATTQETTDALLRLAERFEAVVERRVGGRTVE